MDFTTTTTSKINTYVEALNARDQEKLLNALEKKVLMDEARRLNKSVKKNTLPIEEICDEINEARRNCN